MARTEKALRDHVQYPRVQLTVYLLEFMRTFLVFLWNKPLWRVFSVYPREHL